MTDMVIPPEAVKALAWVIAEASSSDWDTYTDETKARLVEPSMPIASEGLEAALPHLRPMLELAGNLGRELGRREAAEEIAAKCHRRAQLAERVPEGEQSGAREAMVLTWLEAERLASEIATKETQP